MSDLKQQLWNEFIKNGDIFSYLAYCGAVLPRDTSSDDENLPPE